jgi:hypothetical protein
LALNLPSVNPALARMERMPYNTGNLHPLGQDISNLATSI